MIKFQGEEVVTGSTLKWPGCKEKLRVLGFRFDILDVRGPNRSKIIK